MCSASSSFSEFEFDCSNEYVNVLDYESDASARIYESVVQRAEAGRKRPSSALESVLAEPKTKREHCLRELLEKEANYVQALAMLHNVSPFFSVLLFLTCLCFSPRCALASVCLVML